MRLITMGFKPPPFGIRFLGTFSRHRLKANLTSLRVVFPGLPVEICSAESVKRSKVKATLSKTRRCCVKVVIDGYNNLNYKHGWNVNATCES